MRMIPNTNCIGSYFHCGNCLDERPDGTSPSEWARLAVGYSEIGIQV
jgi:hypothetical protein